MVILIILSLLLLSPLMYERFSVRAPTAPDLSGLLARAEAQWNEAKLLLPQGDNAYETYQRILQLSPDNSDAIQGVQRISHHFQQLAQAAQQQNKLTESLSLIRQALQIMPSNLNLLAFERKIVAEIAKQEQLTQQTNKINKINLLLEKAQQYLNNSQLKLAYDAYQEILLMDSNQPQAREGLQKLPNSYEKLARAQQDKETALIILQEGIDIFPNYLNLQALHKDLSQQITLQKTLADLFQKAKILLASNSLTEPEDNNALNTFQQILKLSPNNKQAIEGIRQIADSYEKLARNEPDPQKKLIWVQKGLSVMPDHGNLLVLLKSLSQPTVNPEPPAKPVKEAV
ncbi:MAG: hypothetical protein R3E08_14440, partial [Thiotrichaceae bacterium]